jgi:hypothetical protein
MPRSTLLLFKLIRGRVALGMGGAFFLFLSLSKPSVECDCLTLLPAAALVLTSLMGLYAFLGRTLFPVTDRQVAWIPLTVWGLVTLSGLAGLATGQGIAVLAGWPFFRDGFQQDLTTLPFLPFVLFLLLILWRGDRISPGATLLVFLMFCIFTSLNYWISDSLEAATSHPAKWPLIPSSLLTHPVFTAWPVWILGCLFLIWEGPQQTATLRRREFENQNDSIPNLGFSTFQGPIRRTWPTHLMDGLIPFVWFSYFLNITTKNIQQIHFSRNDLFVFILLSCYFIHAWKQSRGSGLGRVRSAAISLLGMTLVGYVALRDRLGVARGTVARCPFCHNWRMVWYRECPHCGDHQSETTARSRQETPSPLKVLLWPRHDPAALFFRCILLVVVVFFCIYVRILIR